jgi:glucose-6-phosphate isomerase
MAEPFSVKSHFATLSIGTDLRLSSEGFTAEEGTRTLGDLTAVLRDKPGPKLPNDTVLYRMYRSFMRPSDAKLFKARHLRHDITIMAPLDLGSEPNKTLGHFHPVASGELTYPEIYHVLNGSAVYLLQKEENGEVADFVKVDARQGDAIIIPPNYGHVTVNIGNEPLVMANLVSDKFSSIYEGYEKMGGAAYYLLRDGRLVANPRYNKLRKPRTSRPNFMVSKDLYDDFLSCPSCFAYLNQPIKLGGLGKL